MFTRERISKALMVSAAAIGAVGWLMMWFTEEDIWSAHLPQCSAYLDIELKGRIYHTCSYFAKRYNAGEYIFAGSWLAMMCAIAWGGSKMPFVPRKKADRTGPRSDGK